MKLYGYEAEKQLQFVSDSVLSFAYTLKNLHSDLCNGKPVLCSQMKPIDGTVLLNYLKTVTFSGKKDYGMQFYYVSFRKEKNFLNFIIITKPQITLLY